MKFNELGLGLNMEPLASPPPRYTLGNASIEIALSLHGVPLRKEAGG